MRGAHALINRARVKVIAMLFNVGRRNILSAVMLTQSLGKLHTGLSRVNASTARYHCGKTSRPCSLSLDPDITFFTMGLMR